MWRASLGFICVALLTCGHELFHEADTSRLCHRRGGVAADKRRGGRYAGHAGGGCPALASPAFVLHANLLRWLFFGANTGEYMQMQDASCGGDRSCGGFGLGFGLLCFGCTYGSCFGTAWAGAPFAATCRAAVERCDCWVMVMGNGVGSNGLEWDGWGGAARRQCEGMGAPHQPCTPLATCLLGWQA